METPHQTVAFYFWRRNHLMWPINSTLLQWFMLNFRQQFFVAVIYAKLQAAIMSMYWMSQESSNLQKVMYGYWSVIIKLVTHKMFYFICCPFSHGSLLTTVTSLCSTPYIQRLNYPFLSGYIMNCHYNYSATCSVCLQRCPPLAKPVM